MLPHNCLLYNRRYRIIKPIGKGGMGRVYMAMDEKFDAIVAIKERYGVDSNELRKAFEQEARRLALLKHRSLPRVTEHFFEGSRQFLVMDFIEGIDLSARLNIRKRPFLCDEIVPVMEELLIVLEYLHTREPPIIHRDIKPANIKWIEENDEVFLLDFGLAKGGLGTPLINSTTSSISGLTPAYAPLEQLNKSGTNAQSDLYSVAATFYHLLTGRPPVKAFERYDAIKHGHPDPLHTIHKLNAKVPHAISDIIAQAMMLDCKDRITSARKMRRMLQEACASIKKEQIKESGPWNFAAGSTVPATQAGPSPLDPSTLRVNPPVVAPPPYDPFASEADVSWPSQITSESGEPEQISNSEIGLQSDEVTSLQQVRPGEVTEAYVEAEGREQERREQEERDAIAREKLQLENEVRKRAEAEAKRKAEEEVRRLAEDEAARRRAEEARQQQAEVQRRAQEEAASKNAEEEARRRAEKERQEREQREKEERGRIERRRKMEEPVNQRPVPWAFMAEIFSKFPSLKRNHLLLGLGGLVIAVLILGLLLIFALSRLGSTNTEDNSNVNRGNPNTVVPPQAAAAVATGPKWQRALSLQYDDEVWAVSFTLDGSGLAFSGKGGVIKRWHISKKEWLKDLNTGKTQEWIKWLSYSPEGTAIISADTDGNIKGWYAIENPPWTDKPFKGKDDLSSHQAEVNALTFLDHPDNLDATSVASGSSDTTVKLWNYKRRYMGTLKEGDHGQVLTVAFRDNYLLASGNEDGTIQLWNVTAQTLKQTLHRQHTLAVTAIAFSPDHKLMASASADQTIKLWDTNKWEVVRTLSGHQGRVNAVAFSLDGNILASGGDDSTIYLWETKTGAINQTLTEHKDAVLSLCFYLGKKPARPSFASGSKDRTVILWQLK